MKMKVSVAVLRFVGGVCFSAVLSQSVHAQTGSGSAVTVVTAGQITFSVENLDLVSDWYVKMLGFKVSRTSTPIPGFTHRTVVIPGFAIDLVKKNGSMMASWPYSRYMQQGYVHFAFNCSDLSGSLKALQAANADVTPLRDDKGAINRLIVHDPEGNELELFNGPQ